MHLTRHAVSRCAALAAGLLCVAPVTAAHAAAPEPQPPATMSTVGGDRLGQPGVQVDPQAGAPALPGDLTGLSWVVSDAKTGEVLAAKNSHWPLPPASTLKMLFADTVLPKIDKSTVHHVTPADLAGLGEGSSLVGVDEDLDYKVEDLWRGVFLASGNDAVHVLAAMNGGVPQTVTQMQAKADALQAHDTHVVTPDGYDENGQVSSAYDLSLFARAGLSNADFRSYCGTKTAQFPGRVDKATGQRGSFAITNTDRLLGKYPGLIGVKNGYTTNAGSTFTGAAERDGRTLVVTVMHPATYMKVYEEAAALLDWGFAAEGKVTPVGKLVDEAPASAAPSAKPGDSAAAAAPAANGQAPQAAPVPHESRLSTWLGIGLAGAALLAAALFAMTRRGRSRSRSRGRRRRRRA